MKFNIAPNSDAG